VGLILKSWRFVALVAGGAAAAQWSPAPAAHLLRLASAFKIPTTLPSARGVLLTFDDGPHPRGTPAVLAGLDRTHVPATFFVTGEQVVRYPGLVGEIAAAGHEIALHGYRHQTRREWSRATLTDDTRRALDAVGEAGGAPPRLYRPPHGVFTWTGLRLIRGLGLEPLLWSKWGRDWERRANASTIAERATTGIRAGDVVLLHDADHYGAQESWRRTAAALPGIVERLGAAGLTATSVRAGPESRDLELAI
jgi:peptidoglycan-N-acetylglucosamine deacetylase